MVRGWKLLGCTAGKTSEPCLSPKTKYRSTKLCKLVPAPIKYDTVVGEGDEVVMLEAG